MSSRLFYVCGKEGMQTVNAVIYTKDDCEYASLAGILREESEQIDVFRDPLDGHAHYEYPYDIIIVALEGAKGMNTALEWSQRHPGSGIIWLTSDRDFAKVAIRHHLPGFLVRPYDDDEFRESVKKVLTEKRGRKAKTDDRKT